MHNRNKKQTSTLFCRTRCLWLAWLCYGEGEILFRNGKHNSDGTKINEGNRENLVRLLLELLILLYGLLLGLFFFEEESSTGKLKQNWLLIQLKRSANAPSCPATVAYPGQGAGNTLCKKKNNLETTLS